MAVIVDLSTNTATGGSALGDVISGFENLVGSNAADNLTGTATGNLINGSNGSDEIFGLAGNDTLLGGSGNDDLFGGDGNDILWGSTNGDVVGTGGSGFDTLNGGLGNDTFLYTSTLESGVETAVDIVNAFENGFDRFDFAQIDAKAATAGDQSFLFIGSANFSAEGQIRVFQYEDYAVIELNTSGASGAEMQIALFNFNPKNVDATDFIL